MKKSQYIWHGLSYLILFAVVVYLMSFIPRPPQALPLDTPQEQHGRCVTHIVKVDDITQYVEIKIKPCVALKSHVLIYARHPEYFENCYLIGTYVPYNVTERDFYLTYYIPGWRLEKCTVKNGTSEERTILIVIDQIWDGKKDQEMLEVQEVYALPRIQGENND